MARLGNARHGLARRGDARHGMAMHGLSTADSAFETERLRVVTPMRLGLAWRGRARHGTVRSGAAQQDKDCKQWIESRAVLSSGDSHYAAERGTAWRC